VRGLSCSCNVVPYNIAVPRISRTLALRPVQPPINGELIFYLVIVATSLPFYVIVGFTFARGGQLTASWTDQIRWLDRPQQAAGPVMAEQLGTRHRATWYTMIMHICILICYNTSLESSYSILVKFFPSTVTQLNQIITSTAQHIQ
jgi:hypothetical protein